MALVLDGDNGIVGVLATNADGDVIIDTNTFFVDAPNNSVGIGTLTPTRKLHVNGSGRFDMAAGTVRISEQQSMVSVQGVNNAENAFADLKIDGSNVVLNVQSGGNVGIGTSSPQDALTIQTAHNKRVLTIENDNGNDVFQFVNNDGGGNAEIRMWKNSESGTHTQNVEIRANGNSYFNGGHVAVGTSTPSIAPNGAFSWANPLMHIKGTRPTLYLDGTGNISTIRMWPYGSSTTDDDFHINAISASGSSPGYISFAPKGGADGSALAINTDLVVTTPKNPAGQWSMTVSSGAVRSTTIHFNQGNCVSSEVIPGGSYGSRGVFTSPVSGVYQVNVHITGTQSTSNALLSLYHSGQSGQVIVNGAELIDLRQASGLPNDGIGTSFNVHLDTNDTLFVDWYPSAPTAYLDTNMTIRASMHLVG